MLFYKCLKISLINFLNLPKKGANRLFRLGSYIKTKISNTYNVRELYKNSSGHKNRKKIWNCYKRNGALYYVVDLPVGEFDLGFPILPINKDIISNIPAIIAAIGRLF